MAAASGLWGAEYYLTPLVDRPFADAHEALKPSGIVGHGLGIVGSAFMIIGVVMYSSRKRVSALSRLGRLGRWLDVHIFLCTMGPFLVLLHTSFKFGGVVSIAVWCMLSVVVSGVFGRYVYSRIPKSLDGQFLEPEVLRAHVARVDSMLCTATGLSAADVARVTAPVAVPETSGLLRALSVSLQNDLFWRRRIAAVFNSMQALNVDRRVIPQALALLEERVRIETQYAIRRPMTRMFGYWHVFHLPLAIVMFLVMIAHVAVVAAFGYLWIF